MPKPERQLATQAGRQAMESFLGFVGFPAVGVPMPLFVVLHSPTTTSKSTSCREQLYFTSELKESNDEKREEQQQQHDEQSFIVQINMIA
ncbi:hypothetical protein V6N13_037622 [Hibiscus sabdariffa]